LRVSWKSEAQTSTTIQSFSPFKTPTEKRVNRKNNHRRRGGHT
jgi:hypothetical protein